MNDLFRTRSRDIDTTIEYYDQNAATFFSSTVGVDMSPLYERFIDKLPKGASILDAGCGSGRDAHAFTQMGFAVTAFDASPELAKLASQHCGFDVSVRQFSDVDEVHAYNGVWCCASLLHVPRQELALQVGRLWHSLCPGGVFYASFKLGDSDRVDDGRSFTDIDEAALQDLFFSLTGIGNVETWITVDQRPGRSERWVNALATRDAPPTQLKLVTGGTDPFLPHLSHALAQANQIEIAVAFVKVTGLRLLMPDLLAALDRNSGHENRRCNVRILTSDYLDVTDPEALRLLLLLQERGAETKIFSTVSGGSFHLKAYVFASVSKGNPQFGTAFIGSSNISGQALREGLEWNYRISFPEDEGFLEVRQRFEELFRNDRVIGLTNAWVDAYELRRVQPLRQIAPGSNEREPAPIPNQIQREALDALTKSRQEGYRRGLIVLATGLGKTWLAAFDSVAMGAKRVLFVAHREEILTQAAETFLRIRPNSRVGFYVGKNRDADADVLCASVQTLARSQHIERFSPQHFDYVVIDEFHHAAASTYRRLLSHFAPAFLLGLTATPERSDQSDILSLCDDNLVFTRDLFAGIEAKLLSPFHYYGIFDESVDYEEIPWRNGRFDPEHLSTKLATLIRARHALKEWKERAQLRTLAFCVSIRHADFMAEQFNRAGIASAAVYAGSSVGRAEALEALKAGRIQIIFSVDLFNEGVDLPEIDTVMMLRPTESKILFLQQLGRGLRRASNKEKLVVLDFIGNHQSFLHKPQALFQAGTTYKALAQFARKAEVGQLAIPDGCYVNFHLALIDFMKSLDSPGPAKEYEALRASIGRRPTLTEFYHSGASLQAMRHQYGSWFRLVAEMGDVSDAERPLLSPHSLFLRDIEVTQMTRCFKMILLEAYLELDGLSSAPMLEAICERSWQVLQRRKSLLRDLPDAEFQSENGKSLEWQAYWRKYPIHAWIGGNRASSDKNFFAIKDGRLSLVELDEIDDSAAFNTLIQELVDYRLAAYEARQSQKAESTTDRPSRDGRDALPAYMREEIPALFDEEFNPGNWHSGHVVLNDKKIHVLLVTLNKQGKSSQHRYHDHWIDNQTFHWQSQNSTAPGSKKGLEVIEHVKRGIAIHLFIRETKLSEGKAAPFTYHGKVTYQSHAGSSPMSVIFKV